MTSVFLRQRFDAYLKFDDIWGLLMIQNQVCWDFGKLRVQRAAKSLAFMAKCIENNLLLIC